MAYYCYMLECSNGSYYTGWSVDPLKRSVTHNTGNGARYTRMHRPVKLVYIEELGDRASAQKRENEIKRLTHAQKRLLIERSAILSVTLPELSVSPLIDGHH